MFNRNTPTELRVMKKKFDFNINRYSVGHCKKKTTRISHYFCTSVFCISHYRDEIFQTIRYAYMPRRTQTITTVLDNILPSHKTNFLKSIFRKQYICDGKINAPFTHTMVYSTSQAHIPKNPTCQLIQSSSENRFSLNAQKRCRTDD